MQARDLDLLGLNGEQETIWPRNVTQRKELIWYEI